MERALQPPPDKRATKRHPIQVVSRRTGISVELLRTWERRYAIVAPARTTGGRRLYSDLDLDRLQLVQQAIAGGRPVGQLAGCDDEELAELVREDRRGDSGAPVTPLDRSAASRLLAECWRALDPPDGARLAELLGRAARELPPDELVDALLLPLLRSAPDGR